MVRALANIPLAAATQIMSTNLGDPQSIGWVVFQNESPLSVDIDMGVIGHVVVPANYLWPIDTQDPAYDGWDGYATVINPTQDLTIATGTNPGSYLRVHLFRSGEPCPITAPQPLNRSTNVGGGAVSALTTQKLFPENDTVRFLDGFWDAASAQFRLRPNSPGVPGPGVRAALDLQHSDSSGVFHDDLSFDAVTGNMTVANKIAGVNGEGCDLQGFGAPVVDNLLIRSKVTTTVSTGIFSVTTSATDGIYELGGYLFLNNGTSGNVLTFRVNFTDPDRGSAVNLNMWTINGSVSQAFNGVNSFANGSYPLLTYTLAIKGGSVLTWTYQDPTNTPADFITLTMKRIA